MISMNVCWYSLGDSSTGVAIVVECSFNVLVNCMLFIIVDRQKTGPIPPVGEKDSKIWGLLEKQLINYNLISDFVGPPKQWGAYYLDKVVILPLGFW